MSAKKPRFKPRVGWAEESRGMPKFVVVCGPTTHWKEGKTRVRVTDTRDLTAEQAIAKCINQAWINTEWTAEKACKAICPQGYSARIVNGKVRVRRAKP